MDASERHVPVMLERVVALLAPALAQPGAVLVDATLGLGGHSEAFLQQFPDIRLIGLDRDPAALRLAGERLAPYEDRTTFVKAVYDELPEVLEDLGVPAINGILFDLGVSSMQLDEADRGFAYAQDAPLDMRMDSTGPTTAADILNTYSSADLARILFQYGEEKFSRRIADRIVREREAEPFTNSARLSELVRDSIPQAARRTGGHPAKRTFQALRIEVNGELEVLRRALPNALRSLALHGRIVVMSYQSLEDRIAKQTLAAGTKTDVPDDLPVIPAGHEPYLQILTRGAERPTEEELAANPRAASVRVRAAERVRVKGMVVR
ncbi:16S rRNA (cytosine(1402)-N(4))-methyltransferase RsmH [Kribbella antibiotica]|uniref:Ribosomal RNA small subunit methyltransferase H n=1 Tax=Kribbella antibiotica TaxID=190195 RepID=A0A4R4ZS83_9ACTN|nr:16S rRNA (cytosine(1402)-N(4))-methyltransferase RsmH [Kribbella antibiotica]TDD61106.1 16S rRNA (cytosine(1402)-N(4))-methyltransferase RsmH [Kribbella antibiotica]